MCKQLQTSSFSLPYVTSSHLKLSATFNKSASSFIVEELPLYSFWGSGQHLICKVIKQGKNTQEVVQLIGQHFKLHSKDIGVAGQKDKEGLTSQYISLSVGAKFPLETAKKIAAAISSGPSLLVTPIGFHNNKIRTGHLAGNKFIISLENVAEDDLSIAQQLIAEIAQNGVPNFYGKQRFGVEHKNIKRGLQFLSGERKNNGHWQNKFISSAYQSYLFNRWLAARISDGLYNKIIPGDIFFNIGKSRPLTTEIISDAHREFAEHKIVYTGPIYGPQMLSPKDEALAREESILLEEQIDKSLFNTKETPGARREALLYPAINVTNYDKGHQKLQLCFTLPPGAYATIVLREFLKND